jgi:hypothetical protein
MLLQPQPAGAAHNSRSPAQLAISDIEIGPSSSKPRHPGSKTHGRNNRAADA